MYVFRAAWRLALLLGYFLRFGIELVIHRYADRAERAEWLHRFCRTAVHGLGINVTVEGTFPDAGAVISNHLSYVDIVLFAALHPCVFCAKAEIEKWPVIGWMTTMSGAVFIERGRGGSALRARSGMQAAAEAGLPVVFFPEGTTSDGSVVLPFHSGLLAQAMVVDQSITPACLSYTLQGENPEGYTARNSVAWGDDKPLPLHILRFLGLRGVHAHVTFAAQPLMLGSDVKDRKAAAIKAQAAVLSLSTGIAKTSS